jgi:hypothetical protein
MRGRWFLLSRLTRLGKVINAWKMELLIINVRIFPVLD